MAITWGSLNGHATLDYYDNTSALGVTPKIIAVSFEVRSKNSTASAKKDEIEEWISKNLLGGNGITNIMNYSVTWKKDGTEDYAIVSVTQKQ